MGGGRSPSPSVTYIPAPPPPQTQQVTSQSLQSQIKLTENNPNSINNYSGLISI